MNKGRGNETTKDTKHQTEYVHVLIRDEKRKEDRSKQGQVNNKAKQHSTPKAVTFLKKNELPQYTLDKQAYYISCIRNDTL